MVQNIRVTRFEMFLFLFWRRFDFFLSESKLNICFFGLCKTFCTSCDWLGVSSSELDYLSRLTRGKGYHRPIDLLWTQNVEEFIMSRRCRDAFEAHLLWLTVVAVTPRWALINQSLNSSVTFRQVHKL